jgi:hypothetical protein
MPDVVKTIEETVAVKLAKIQAKKAPHHGTRWMADTHDETTVAKSKSKSE